jgi:hypothetical protein
MYPASSALSGDLLWEDLPETLKVRGRVVYKQSGTGVIPNGPTIYEDANPDPVDGFQYILLDRANTKWAITDSTDGLTGDDYILDADLVECLITGDGNFTPGNDWVEDQFEACYKIYIQEEGYPRNLYATVERVDLCKWTNYADYIDPFGSSPWWVELIYRPDIQKWVADLGGVPFAFFKTPHQDTPAGEYPAVDNPSYTVTVEPC